MRNNVKRVGFTIIAILCAALMCTAALAEFTAQLDKTAIQDGDTVTATITVTGKNLSVAEGTFTYDPSLLEFEESDGGATDGLFAMYSAEKNGSSTLSATVTFTASGAGTSSIEFALEKLVDYNGKSLDTGTATVSVEIAAAPPEPTPPPVDYSDPAIAVKAENVKNAAGDMYIWRSIENVTIPSRYTESDVVYHEETVKGALVVDSDAPALLYLSDAAGENAGYYVYDTARDMLYPYMTVSSVSKSYIILEPSDSVVAPSGFTPATLTISEKDVPVWSMEDAQGKLYLVYARNPSGEIGFFYYNPNDESLQRYSVQPARPVVEPNSAAADAAATAPVVTEPVATDAPKGDVNVPVPEEAAPSAISPTLFYIVCGAAVVFLGLFVYMLVHNSLEEKRRRKRFEERRRREKSAIDTQSANVDK